MIQLENRRALRLENQRGATIRVVEGRVWITIANCAEDLVLCAGQSHRIEHEGRVVLESWPTRQAKSGDATIELIPAAHARAVIAAQRPTDAAEPTPTALI